MIFSIFRKIDLIDFSVLFPALMYETPSITDQDETMTMENWKRTGWKNAQIRIIFTWCILSFFNKLFYYRWWRWRWRKIIKTPPRYPKMPQDTPRYPKLPQDNPRYHQDTPKMPQDAPRRPNIQNCPDTSRYGQIQQNDSRYFPVGPSMIFPYTDHVNNMNPKVFIRLK